MYWFSFIVTLKAKNTLKNHIRCRQHSVIIILSWTSVMTQGQSYNPSLNAQRWLTNDIAAVISNEGLAVNIDEFCDRWLGELGMRPQSAQCDVLCPLILHCRPEQNHIIYMRWCEMKTSRVNLKEQLKGKERCMLARQQRLMSGWFPRSNKANKWQKNLHSLSLDRMENSPRHMVLGWQNKTLH